VRGYGRNGDCVRRAIPAGIICFFSRLDESDPSKKSRRPPLLRLTCQQQSFLAAALVLMLHACRSDIFVWVAEGSGGLKTVLGAGNDFVVLSYLVI
jgi:hypothetical protein